MGGTRERYCQQHPLDLRQFIFPKRSKDVTFLPGIDEEQFNKRFGAAIYGFGTAGVQSMVPFLQNANNLTSLDLDENIIQSEGFNFLFRALGVA